MLRLLENSHFSWADFWGAHEDGIEFSCLASDRLGEDSLDSHQVRRLIDKKQLLEGRTKHMYDWPNGAKSESFQDWVDTASLAENRPYAEEAIRKGWLHQWLDSIGDKDLASFLRENRGAANGIALVRRLAQAQLQSRLTHLHSLSPSDRAACGWGGGDEKPGTGTLALLQGLMGGALNNHSGSGSVPRIPTEIMLALSLRDIATPGEIA